MDVDAVDAGHRVVEQQPGLDLIDADALGDGAVGVSQDVSGLAGQRFLPPHLGCDDGALVVG